MNNLLKKILFYITSFNSIIIICKNINFMLFALKLKNIQNIIIKIILRIGNHFAINKIGKKTDLN